MKLPDRIETIVSVALVALVIVGCLMVLRPFMSAILWAGVLCYCTWPVFKWMKAALGGRRSLAALAMTLLLGLVMVAPFVVVGTTLASNVARMGEWFRHFNDGLSPEAPAWIVRIPWIGDNMAVYWGSLAQDTARTSKLIQEAAFASGKWALRHSLDFAMGIAQLLLSLLVAFAFYREGEWIVERIVTGGRRVAGDSVQRHLNTVGRTVRSVVFGVIGTGMVQGILAGLGFWLAGLPSPFLLGLLTLVFSFLPAGPPFVWVPAAVWLYSEGEGGWALFMTLWGLFAISGIDNLVRPYLIKHGTNLPFVTILMGVLGGLIVFGFIGLFLGPVLLAVGYGLVHEFTSEQRARKQAATRPTPTQVV